MLTRIASQRAMFERKSHGGWMNRGSSMQLMVIATIRRAAVETMTRS